MRTPGSITVIVPSLNEERCIRASVAPAVAGAARVIVVDCGSTQRWDEKGFWRTTLVNWCMMALYSLGWPRERLARIYGVRGS